MPLWADMPLEHSWHAIWLQLLEAEPFSPVMPAQGRLALDTFGGCWTREAKQGLASTQSQALEQPPSLAQQRNNAWSTMLAANGSIFWMDQPSAARASGRH